MLDILLPTYNRKSRLETCLYALTLQDPPLPRSHRVIICEDYSPDPVEDTVKTFSDKLNIEFYRMDENKGTAAVRRFLISKLKQKLVMWLDDDVILFKDAIYLHMIGCSMENAGVSVGTMEDIIEEESEIILHHSLEARIDLMAEKAKPEGREKFENPQNYIKAWGAAWTGNLMMLKEHGDKVGWLDEDVVGWGHDDTVLTVKLVGEGIPMWYDKNIRGYHLRQDAGRRGNLGLGYHDTALKNSVILNKYLRKYNITWEG